MNEKFESAMPWLFVAGLLLVWQLACVGFSIPNFILPRPSVVAMPVSVDAMNPPITTTLFSLSANGGISAASRA